MTLNRLLPQGILRIGSQRSIRQFSSSFSVRNSTTESEIAEANTAKEPVEITPSHRRDVRVRMSREQGTTEPEKRSTRNDAKDRQSAKESTDFFDDPTSVTSTSSRTSGQGDSGISMDLLSADEYSEVKDKSKRAPKPVARESGDNRWQGQGQGQGGQSPRYGQGDRGGRRDGRSQGRDASASGPRSGPGQGRGQGPAQGRAQGQGQGRREGGRRNDRDSSRDDGKQSAPVVSRPIQSFTATFDNSFASLFGAASLVTPARRGARDAASSFWAKDLEASKARKADLMRLAGSYDLRLPTVPHPSTLKPSTAAPERAKSIARWTISTNPSIPLRARDPGMAVVERLLR